GLENETGISFSQLGKIERGDSVPSRDNVIRLGESLKIDKNYFLVIAGYLAYEVTIATAQLLEELWGDEEYDKYRIDAKDIMLIRNSMAIKENYEEYYLRADIEPAWAKFISDMEKRRLAPHKIKEIINTVDSIRSYINRLDAIDG